jgi:hypothetical protein
MNFFRHFSHTTLMRKKGKPERIIGGLGLDCFRHKHEATQAAWAQWMADAAEAAAAVTAEADEEFGRSEEREEKQEVQKLNIEDLPRCICVTS